MKKITLKKTSLSRIASDEHCFRISYRDELNPMQYEAVMHADGPALLIAGAGTGKTRALTYRVARLIESGVHPEAILLLTFTRKAAREMLRRASLLLDERTERVAGGTFHSFANMLLRNYAGEIGYDNNFTILDQGDSEDAINVLRARRVESLKQTRFPNKQTLQRMYSMSVNTLTPIDIVVAERYPQFAGLIEHIEELARDYVVYKKRNNTMDYDDLLVNLVILLEQAAQAQRYIGERYRYIMVDEYQDTNKLQARIVRKLACTHDNVLVVGDDAQSIYSFRGANFRNIMDFPKDFADCRIIKLEQNYRSTQPILNFTNEIIRRAAEQYSKELFSNKPEGMTPALVKVDGEHMQSRYIANSILELREEGVELKDIAVLFRAGYHSFDLEIELARVNLPYVKYGGLKLMETAHIKDVLAHLRIVENPRDIVAWTRALLLLDGIGPVSAENVTNEIIRGIDPLLESSEYRLLQLVRGDSLSGMLGMLRGIAEPELAPGDKLTQLMDYYGPILRDRYDDHPKRMRDLEMLQSIAARYRQLSVMLTDMALEPPNESVRDIEAEGKEREFLTLSTIHSAKGLEWNTVFVMYLVDGRFPSTASAESAESLEEERRLFYVACTRAARRLFLTMPTNVYDRASGMILNKASRFLDSMPEQLLESFVVEVE